MSKRVAPHLRKRLKLYKKRKPPGPKQPALLTSLREGITLSELGRHTGLSVSHLSLIFRYKCSPSVHSAKKIAKALRLKLDHLYDALQPPAAQ